MNAVATCAIDQLPQATPSEPPPFLQPLKFVQPSCEVTTEHSADEDRLLCREMRRWATTAAQSASTVLRSAK